MTPRRTGLFGTLAIRADASAQVGMGHIMRCLALAQAWQDCGGKVVLVTKELPLALRQRFEAENIPVEAQIPSQAEWVVLDGYHFTSVFRRSIKESGHRLLVVDDLADSDLSDADLVLNHNAYASPAMYPAQRSLCGSSYTLLRREFATGAVRSSSKAPLLTVLITMGGSDPCNATLDVLQQLAGVQAIRQLVLVGPANQHVGTLRSVPGVEIIVNPPDLPAVMQQADLAITAAGSTCWELAALGVPMLLQVIADNQNGIAEHLIRQEAARRFSIESLRELISQPQALETLAKNALRLVDGYGAARVSEALAAHPLSLRRATMDDAQQLLDWANDPTTRQNSFNSESISWETHVCWLQRRLADSTCVFFIAEADDEAVGTARFNSCADDEAEISFVLAPSARGRGLGAKLIRLATFQVRDASFCTRVSGWVKAGNPASQRAFERAGFTVRQRAEQHGADSIEFISEAARLAPSHE